METLNMSNAVTLSHARPLDLQGLTSSLESNNTSFDEIWLDDCDLKSMLPNLHYADLGELDDRFMLAVQQNVSVKSLKLVVNETYGSTFCCIWEALCALTELRSLYICPEHEHRMNFECVRRILRAACNITSLEMEGDWAQDSDSWTSNDILCLAAGLLHNTSIEKLKLSQFRAPTLGCFISIIGMTTRTLREVDICPDEAGSRKEPLFDGGAFFQLLQIPTIEKLTLGSFAFDTEHCRCFALGFPTSKVRDLTIWKSNFPDQSTGLLIGGLFSSRNVQTVGLHWNRLPNDFIKYASLALQSNSSVSSFSLSVLEPCRTAASVRISARADLFSGGLRTCLKVNQHLQSLDLSYVKLNDKSTMEIVDGLRCNLSLRKLALMDCNLSCKGFTNLVHAIKHHPTLSTLLCSGNDDICNQCKIKALYTLQANRSLRILGIRSWSQIWMEKVDAEACMNAVKGHFGLVSVDMNLNETQNATIGIILRLNKAGRGRLTEIQASCADFITLLVSVKDDLDCSYHLVLDHPNYLALAGNLSWGKSKRNLRYSSQTMCDSSGCKKHRCDY